MKELFIVFLNVLWIFRPLQYQAKAQSRTNFIIKQFDVCVENSPVTFVGNITNEGRKQYLDFTMKSPIPLDENIGLICQIDSVINAKTSVQLFTIREKRFCEACNKYIGEFWYDIERAAQVPTGLCPIRQGNYHVHHHLMNFQKITLQTFPFGTLRLTWSGVDKRSNKTIFCLLIEVDNML